MHIRIGHSPDPDDAFMFWALAKDQLTSERFTFEHVLADIESLNRWALEGKLEITALSLHAYPYVQDKYVLLPHGASMGDGYGPMVVARQDAADLDLATATVAIPGRMTTAFMALGVYLKQRPENVVVVPFDEIPQYVADGKADAGLLIHEGQLTYADFGLRVVVDLGAWWKDETTLPLPLGVNAVRSDLSLDDQRELSDLLGRSIEMGLDNREEALAYALQFGRGLDTALADQFVGMYVNEQTRNYTERGRAGIERLLAAAEELGFFTEPLTDLPAVDKVAIRWLEQPVAS